MVVKFQHLCQLTTHLVLMTAVISVTHLTPGVVVSIFNIIVYKILFQKLWIYDNLCNGIQNL